MCTSLTPILNLFLIISIGLTSITSEESSDEAGVGPITPKEDFDLESRPFLQGVFDALNCTENDYLVLFGICLLRAIQGNEGKKDHQNHLCT